MIFHQFLTLICWYFELKQKPSKNQHARVRNWWKIIENYIFSEKGPRQALGNTSIRKIKNIHKKNNFSSLQKSFSKNLKFSQVLHKICSQITKNQPEIPSDTEKSWICMFWSIKTIRIGVKSSKTAKCIVEHFPMFFRVFCKMPFFVHFSTFWYRSLKAFFAISPDRPCSQP